MDANIPNNATHKKVTQDEKKSINKIIKKFIGPLNSKSIEEIEEIIK